MFGLDDLCVDWDRSCHNDPVDSGLLCVDLQERYAYDQQNKKTDKQIGWNVFVVDMNNKFEKFSVKLDEIKNFAEIRDNVPISVYFKGLTGKMYLFSGALKISLSAKEIVLLKEK